MAEVKVSALTALTGANVDNGDELYIVDTGSPNVSKKITADELAQMPQLSSRYVSKSEEKYRWLGVGEIVGLGGSSVGFASPVQFGNCAAWLLDAAGTEYINVSTLLPDYWTNFTMSLYWLNVASSSGDVRLVTQGKFAGDTEQTDGANAVNNTQTLAAPTTAGVLKVSPIPASGTIGNVAGQPFSFTMVRLGSDGADTLANDMGIVGILFERTS